MRVPRTFCEQTENTKWNSSNRGSTVASRRRRLGDCRSGLIRVDCSGLITSSRTFLARVSVSALIFRSEEHTSELQSLMRISYAVFCLKKKNNKSTYTKINSKQDLSMYTQTTHRRTR